MKQQRILLLSDHRDAADELPLSRDDGHRLTCCASDTIHTVLERIQHRFDWILIDGAAMGEDQMEFVRSLRAIGFLFSGAPGDDCTGARCSIDWDANGTLQLSCGRRNALRAGSRRQAQAGGGVAGPPDGFVFEYHAPMKRTG